MDDTPNAFRNRTIPHLLSHWAIVDPDKPAFTFLGERGQKEDEISFAALHERAVRLGCHLRSEQLGGQRILIVMPSGIDYMVAFLGCLMAGALAVPLYPPTNKRDWNRLRSVIVDCDPRAMFVNRAVWQRFQTGFSSILAGRECAGLVMDELVLPDAVPGIDIDIDPDGIAFLQYTSGSTGNAKGVMVSHANLVDNARQMAAAMGNDRHSVVVSWLPFYHDMGLIGKNLHALALGAHAVLMSNFCFLRNPINWLNAISRYRGTVTGAPNFAFDLCVDKISEAEIDQLDLSGLKVAYNGSEPIKVATLDRFYQRFARVGFRKEMMFPSYGLAEATLFAAGGPRQGEPIVMNVDRAALSKGEAIPVAAPREGASGRDAIVSCVSVCRSIMDQTLRIVEPTTWTTLPDRRVGEIWLKSPSVARGYWNKPSETAEGFRAYTTDSGEGPFLRTGDLGFLDEGRLFITGRIKEIIILNGVNHYPQDIEETVQSLSEVFRIHAGAALGLEDGGLVILQGLNRAKTTPEEFPDLIKQIRRAVFEVHGVAPSFIALVNPGDIAKTSSGKIQRGLIRRRLQADELPLLASWSSEPAAVNGVKPAGMNGATLKGAASHTPARDASRIDRAAVEPSVAESAATEPSATEPSANEPSVVEPLVAWLRNYFKTRVNSFLIDERRTIPPYVILDFGNQGLLGMLAPREYGGLDLSARDFLRILDVLGSKDLTLALFVGLNNALGIRPIARYGTPEIKARHLRLLATGRELGAFALTEPGAGSNPQAIEALAQQDANGLYRLSGTKYWSGSAAWAGVLSAFAKAVDMEGRAIGVTGFAVPQTSVGLRQGAEALTMGMRGMIQNSVHFDDVSIAPAQILGQPGRGMAIAQDTMCFGRLAISAAALGALKLCYQTMLRYASERQVGTGRLLDNPHARFVLSQAQHATVAVETLLYDAADHIDAGEAVEPEILAACKCLATEFLWKGADDAMQLAGGRGYIESNFIAQLFRDARIFRIFEGPTETLNHFVGSSALAGRAVIRRYLESRLGEAEIVAHYDEVLDRAKAWRSQGGRNDHNDQYGSNEESVALHWRYLVVGDYVNRLVLYAACSGAAADPATCRWALGQVAECGRLLEVTLGKFDELESTDALCRFGAKLDAGLGVREQTYPLPNGLMDPLMARSDPPSQGSAPRRPSADEASPPLESGKIARPAPLLETVPLPSKPSGTAMPLVKMTRDIETFITRWVARRCGLPVQTIKDDIEFAAMGLGSIDSIELSDELSSQFNLDLDPTAFWNHPTSRDLARFVQSELDAQHRRRNGSSAAGRLNRTMPDGYAEGHRSVTGRTNEMSTTEGGV